MSTITALHIYPIKSLGPVDVTEVQVYTEGLQHDRRWMLVDEKGGFLTQRTDSRLALFQVAISNDSLKVQYKSESIEFPLDEHLAETTRVQVWSSKLKANEVNPKYSKWFSDILDQPCTLVRMTEASKRPKRLFVAPFKTELSLADAYPFLFLGSASMSELNNRCSEAIPADRFRANIILDTSIAHEEDEYGQFSLGSATFKIIKPCARCHVVNIDQQSGEKKTEPNKTLATYRKRRNKIYFGANAILVEAGVIKIGDRVNKGLEV